MSVQVKVNDPAFDDGAEISVYGIRVPFVNGHQVTVHEEDVDRNSIGDADVTDYLSQVAGFTVTEKAETADEKKARLAAEKDFAAKEAADLNLPDGKKEGDN